MSLFFEFIDSRPVSRVVTLTAPYKRDFESLLHALLLFTCAFCAVGYAGMKGNRRDSTADEPSYAKVGALDLTLSVTAKVSPCFKRKNICLSAVVMTEPIVKVAHVGLD